MKIKQRFNQLTVKEYCFVIDNHKKFTNFNTLGLYRSILGNEIVALKNKRTTVSSKITSDSLCYLRLDFRNEANDFSF